MIYAVDIFEPALWLVSFIALRLTCLIISNAFEYYDLLIIGYTRRKKGFAMPHHRPQTTHIHYISPWDLEAGYRGKFIQRICDRSILHIYQPIRHRFIVFHTARFLCRITTPRIARIINRLFLRLFNHPLF